jgi:hypothetical protein
MRRLLAVIWEGMPFFLVMMILLCITLGMMGCTSNKDQAQRNLISLRHAVDQVRTRADRIGANATIIAEEHPHPLLEDITKDASAIRDVALQARTTIDKTQTNVGHLKDPVPFWVYLFQTWGLVALLVAVTVLLVYLGVGAVVRPILQRFGLLLSRSVRTAAKLDAESVVRGRATEDQHRVITARRTAEPGYDVAFRHEKERLEHALH